MPNNSEKNPDKHAKTLVSVLSTCMLYIDRIAVFLHYLQFVQYNNYLFIWNSSVWDHYVFPDVQQNYEWPTISQIFNFFQLLHLFMPNLAWHWLTTAFIYNTLQLLIWVSIWHRQHIIIYIIYYNYKTFSILIDTHFLVGYNKG